MSQPPQTLDTWMLAIVIILTVAGVALGGMLLRVSLLAVPIIGVVYLMLRPTLLRRSTSSPEAETTTTSKQGSDPLWADAEQALLVFDRYPVGGALAESVLRAGRAGRRAVERGRTAPAEPGSVQARHLICLAGDALQAYRDAGEPGTQTESLQALLSEVADMLENTGVSSEADEQLRIRLRVLQRELGKR